MEKDRIKTIIHSIREKILFPPNSPPNCIYCSCWKMVWWFYCDKKCILPRMTWHKIPWVPPCITHFLEPLTLWPWKGTTNNLYVSSLTTINALWYFSRGFNRRLMGFRAGWRSGLIRGSSSLASKEKVLLYNMSIIFCLCRHDLTKALTNANSNLDATLSETPDWHIKETQFDH